MQADRKKFPGLPKDLPDGTQLNEDRRRNVFYAFKTKMVNGIQTRISIGSYYPATKEFKYSKRYLQTIEIDRLQETSDNLRNELKTGEQRVQEKTTANINTEELADLATNSHAISLNSVALITILAMLGKADSCKDIAKFNMQHQTVLADLCAEDLNPSFMRMTDTLDHFLSVIEPEQIHKFLRKMLSPLMSDTSIKATTEDGIELNASDRRLAFAERQNNARYITDIPACSINIKVVRCDKPRNEIISLPALLDSLDICGAIITTEADKTKKLTLEEILRKKANYCLNINNNQSSLLSHIKYVFDNKRYQVISDLSQMKEISRSGYIKCRKITVLPARVIEQNILAEWPGLLYGTVIRVITVSNTASAEKKDIKYLICSLQFSKGIADKIKSVLFPYLTDKKARYWQLNCYFDQERLTGSYGKAFINFMALRKAVFSMLKNEQYYVLKTEGKELSIKNLRIRCFSLQYAVGVIRRWLYNPKNY